MQLSIGAYVTDKTGRVIKRVRRHRANSFVRAWTFVLASQMPYSVPDPVIGPVKDTSNVNQNLRRSYQTFSCAAPAGVTVQGIRVGTDGTAVTLADYALIAPIAHGVGAGQMEHQAQSFAWVGVVAGVCSFTITRSFVNNSGGPITVEECALYIRAINVTPVLVYLCGARDLFTQIVPDGGGVTVVYTLRVVL